MQSVFISLIVILSKAKDLGNTHLMYPRFFASL